MEVARVCDFATSGWAHWITPETVPAWASAFVAIVALIVACSANRLAKNGAAFQLRTLATQTGLEALKTAQETRQIIQSEQRRLKEWVAKLEVHPEVLDVMHEILDFREDLEGLEELVPAPEDHLSDLGSRNDVQSVWREYEQAQRLLIDVREIQTRALGKIEKHALFAFEIAEKAMRK
jgi:hypothetical protein